MNKTTGVILLSLIIGFAIGEEIQFRFCYGSCPHCEEEAETIIARVYNPDAFSLSNTVRQYDFFQPPTYLLGVSSHVLRCEKSDNKATVDETVLTITLQDSSSLKIQKQSVFLHSISWYEGTTPYACKPSAATDDDIDGIQTFLLLTKDAHTFNDINACIRNGTNYGDFGFRRTHSRYVSGYGKKAMTVAISEGVPHFQFDNGDKKSLTDVAGFLLRSKCLLETTYNLFRDKIQTCVHSLNDVLKDEVDNAAEEFEMVLNGFHEEVDAVEDAASCPRISREESERELAKVYYGPDKNRYQVEITQITDFYNFLQGEEEFLHIYLYIGREFFCFDKSLVLDFVMQQHEADEISDDCKLQNVFNYLRQTSCDESSTPVFHCNTERKHKGVDLPQLEIDIEENKLFKLTPTQTEDDTTTASRSDELRPLLVWHDGSCNECVETETINALVYRSFSLKGPESTREDVYEIWDTYKLQTASFMLSCTKIDNEAERDDDTVLTISLQDDYTLGLRGYFYSYFLYKWFEIKLSYACKIDPNINEHVQTFVISTHWHTFSSIVHCVNEGSFCGDYGFQKRKEPFVVSYGNRGVTIISEQTPHFKFGNGDTKPLADIANIILRSKCLFDTNPIQYNHIFEQCQSHLNKMFENPSANAANQFQSIVDEFHAQADNTQCPRISREESERELAKVYYGPHKKRYQVEITQIPDFYNCLQGEEEFLHIYLYIGMEFSCHKKRLVLHYINLQQDAEENDDKQQNLINYLTQKDGDSSTSVFNCNNEQKQKGVNLPQFEINLEENKLFKLTPTQIQESECSSLTIVESKRP